MVLCGSGRKRVCNNGSFRLPARWRDAVKPGMKYNVLLFPEEWNKGLYYLRYSFSEETYPDGIVISTGIVNEDKIFKIPEEYIGNMKGFCNFIGVLKGFEVSRVSIEKLTEGVEMPKELNITFE